MKSCQFTLVAIALIFAGRPAGAADTPIAAKVGALTFKGKILEAEDISGIALRQGLLAIAADEAGTVQILARTADGAYESGEERNIDLPRGADGLELDLEGLAWGDKYLYVIGSHSRARNKADEKRSQPENLQRLQTIKIEPSREALFRVKVKKNGEAGKIKHISLRNLFANHPLLSLFQPIPSKENGIDIEGLAVQNVDDGVHLYLGFRGPLLRGNHALVMALQFEKQQGQDKLKFKVKEISASPLYYLNLSGHGIRGMAEAGDDGLLILAGPVGDAVTDNADSRYPVYLWDGKQAMLTDQPMKPLCHAPLPSPKSKAEGIELLNKDRSSGDPYRLLFVYDGAERGSPLVLNCGP